MASNWWKMATGKTKELDSVSSFQNRYLGYVRHKFWTRRQQRNE